MCLLKNLKLYYTLHVIYHIINYIIFALNLALCIIQDSKDPLNRWNKEMIKFVLYYLLSEFLGIFILLELSWHTTFSKTYRSELIIFKELFEQYSCNNISLEFADYIFNIILEHCGRKCIKYNVINKPVGYFDEWVWIIGFFAGLLNLCFIGYIFLRLWFPVGVALVLNIFVGIFVIAAAACVCHMFEELFYGGLM